MKIDQFVELLTNKKEMILPVNEYTKITRACFDISCTEWPMTYD
jgi:hypothetical protein